MNPSVSVIVPIYNARKLMFYTAESLLNQTLRDIEVLFVDDCSADGSAALLEERYAGDARVRVIRQERNGGPGEARNRGIAEARGSYVCFCDSDDQLPPAALEEMYAAALAWDADVVHSTAVLFSLEDDTPGDMLSMPDTSWCVVNIDRPAADRAVLLSGSPDELLRRWMRHELHWSAWNKLYRRQLLLDHGIRFGRMRLAEDQQFCFCCLFSAERYLILPGARYCYRQMPDSLSRSRPTMAFLQRALRSGFEVSRSMEEFGQRNPWFGEHPQALEQAAAYILECLETAYTRKAWAGLGEEAVLADEGIRSLYREYFGDLAFYVLKQSCDAFRQVPPRDTLLELLNSPAGLRQLTAAGRLHTLKEVRETGKTGETNKDGGGEQS